jgi:magnesium chelatase family protein
VALARYARRLSGPLLDRFDLQVMVPVPEPSALFDPTAGESTAVVAERVEAARLRARSRGVVCNARIVGSEVDALAPLDGAARATLEQAVASQRLSARGLRRVRTLALTLADLSGQDPPLGRVHVLEAMALRQAPVGGVDQWAVTGDGEAS